MDVSRDTLKKVFGKERVEDDLHGVIDEILKNPEAYRQKVLDEYESENAEKPEICKECGGVCCLRAPCHWSPKDIKDLSYNGLKKFLKEKNYISIVRFPATVCESALREIKHSGPHYYILRTRTRSTNIATVASKKYKGDRCMLLRHDGCSISFEERPRGARLLIPEQNRKCRHLYDLDDCFYEWKDYQDVLRKLFYYFRIKERASSIIKESVHL